jgi:hypothetical protein
LSTPIEDRSIFVGAEVPKLGTESEIVALGGTDGSQFYRLDLVLPSGSVIKRPSDGTIVIENNRILLRIQCIYDGDGVTLPDEFETNYLGTHDLWLNAESVRVSLSYEIKPFATILNSRWNYHNWIDSFADDFYQYGSFDQFLETIHWESTLTGIIVANLKKKGSERKPRGRIAKR